MLRNKGLTDKLLALGVDGMDPRFTRRLLDEGKMPNLQKLIDRGACREDLILLGANPTITPPMWATLATGAYPMTHKIWDYNISAENDKDITLGAFSSCFMKAEPIFNVTAEAGKKTLVMHWPGGSFPPTTDSPNLFTIDGSSPGAVCAWSNARDLDSVFIASSKAQKVSYMPMSIRTSDIEGDEELKYLGVPLQPGVTQEAKDRVKRYQKEYKEKINVEGYTPDSSYVTDNMIFEETNSLMWQLADFPSTCSISPVFPANGWSFDIPEGAKEFVMVMLFGKVVHNALILKGESGAYDHVAVYSSKENLEPMYVLENDKFTGVYDFVLKQDGTQEKVYRNMRLLKIAEDGSYVRIWSSRGMSCEDDSVWYPKSLFKEVLDNFGPPQPTSQMTGNDADLILKCNNEQWALAAKWQSEVMHYMIEEHGVEAIFSHMHNVDLQGHNYMKYLKERDTSRYSEDEVVKFAEATYKVTDDYIGSFLHLLDEGWTIMLFSDHALICPESETHTIGDCDGVNADPLRGMGYTVLKRDESGKELPEVDWAKTRAIQTRSNSIYLNIKGRDPHGIVDPADKYELEEEIITNLYGFRDEKTGHRIVSLALHNKDAVLLGLGGEGGADIVFFVHDDYCSDHGNGLSTACGHNDTSLSPIFAAAGKGIKEGFRTDRWIREVDVAPTVSVLLGVDFPANCEGAPVYQILSESM